MTDETAVWTEPTKVMAELLGITPRHLQRLAADGHVPKAARGQYEVVATFQAYTRYLQAIVESRANDTTAQEQARLTKERADKLARENEVARGELIPKADVVAGTQTLIAHCRAKLLAIPTKAAPTIITLESVAAIQQKLTDLVHDALNELGETRAAPLPKGRRQPRDANGADGSDEGVAGAAKSDGKRVGGSRKKSKPGVKRGARKVGNRKS